MKYNRNSSKYKTEYIQFDSGKCKACWKCVETCPEKVFGRINLFIHKHALIKNGERCTGCGKCSKACDYEAIIYKLNKEKKYE